MYQIQFAMTNGATSSAHALIRQFRDRPYEEVGADLIVALDQACTLAVRSGQVKEVLDTQNGDETRYCYFLEFPDGPRVQRLVAVVTDDSIPRDQRAPSGKVILRVLPYSRAKEQIRRGRWKPMHEGEEIFPKPGPVDKSTPTERDEFVLGLLWANPKLTTMGRGGIHEQVKERFGVGMREGRVAKLRDIAAKRLMIAATGSYTLKSLTEREMYSSVSSVAPTASHLNYALKEWADAQSALLTAQVRLSQATQALVSAFIAARGSSPP